MKRLFVCVALLSAPSGLTHAQAPDASTIQAAMNDGLELEFPFFQEFANVQVIRGGATDEGDYLFLCTARLVWKLSSPEFATIMQEEINKTLPQQGGNDTLYRTLVAVLSAKLSRIGEFERGNTVTNVRFRVRLERAGVDWLVTTAKIKESNRNPLNIIDKGDR